MADQKLTDKTQLLTVADNDKIAIVDVSDTTQSPQGSSKWILKEDLVKVDTITAFTDLIDVDETTLNGFAGQVPVVSADLTTDPATNKLKFKKMPSFEDIYGGSDIINGGLTLRASGGLDYTIWGTAYLINNVYYGIPVSTEVTNDVGGAQGRFDVYYIEVLDPDNPVPTAGILKGTEGASPVIPTLDLSTRVQVSARLIAAGETVDPNAITEKIYDELTGEPTEWDVIDTPTGANLSDNTDPKVGTVAMSFPAYVTNDVLAFQKDAMYTYVSEESQVFYLRVVSGLTAKSKLQIRLKNSVSGYYWNLSISINNLSSYGFDISNANWQLIQIPLSVFTANSREETEFDIYEITFIETPALEIDWVVFQSNVPNPSNVIKGKFIDGSNTNDAVYLDGAVGIGRSNPFDGIGNEGQLELYSPEPIPVRNLTRINFKSPHYSDAAAIGFTQGRFIIDNINTGGTAVKSLLTELLVTDTGVSIDNGFLTTPGIKTATGTGTKIFLDNGTLVDWLAPNYATFAAIPLTFKGARTSIDDSTLAATSANLNSIAAGGGANFAQVIYDGTNWRIG